MDKFIESAPRSSTTHKRSRIECKSRASQPQKKMTQMFLDLGQKGPNALTQCADCGMRYTPSDADDCNRHSKFCAEVKQGPLFRSPVGLEAIPQIESDTQVFACRASALLRSNGQHSDVAKALELMQRELGSTSDYMQHSAWVYICIRGRRIVGCIVIDHVSPLALIQLSRSDLAIACKDDIYAQMESSSSLPCTSICASSKLGVRLIWVAPLSRRSGVAAMLVDAARLRFSLGAAVPRCEVAFSQPTSSGIAFALAYTKANSIYIYK